MPRKKEDDDGEASLEAYKQFRTLADAGNYSVAYTIFTQRPELINHMSVVEIPSHYTLIMQQLGEKEAAEFKVEVKNQIEDLEKAMEGGEMIVSLLKKSR